jgi:peroxiredoxin
MKWILSLSLTAALLTAWAGVALETRHPSLAFSPSASPPKEQPPEKHYVTSQQLATAGAMSDRSLGPVAAVAHDGKRRGWTELAGPQPVVIVFIKKNCPCNVEFEPFFHRLYEAYRGTVRFVGVIDGTEESARRYANANHTPYLVLADPERRLIGRCQAKNGAYVALVSPSGVLHTLWPGCSADMMQELSHQIAARAGVAEQSVDTSGLPKVLTTGCPFAVDADPQSVRQE